MEEKNIEIVKKMLKLNFTDDIIMKVTSITKEN